MECGVRDSLSRSEVREVITVGHQRDSGRRARFALEPLISSLALLSLFHTPFCSINRNGGPCVHTRGLPGVIRSWLILFSCLSPASRTSRFQLSSCGGDSGFSSAERIRRMIAPK